MAVFRLKRKLFAKGDGKATTIGAVAGLPLGLPGMAVGGVAGKMANGTVTNIINGGEDATEEMSFS